MARVAAPKKAITFKMVAEDLIADRAIGWRDRKSEAQWWSSLKDYVFPHIGSKVPAEIAVDDVLGVLKSGSEVLFAASIHVAMAAANCQSSR